MPWLKPEKERMMISSSSKSQAKFKALFNLKIQPKSNGKSSAKPYGIPLVETKLLNRMSLSI